MYENHSNTIFILFIHTHIYIFFSYYNIGDIFLIVMKLYIFKVTVGAGMQSQREVEMWLIIK